MLPSSIYATAGRRAHGEADVLAADDEYAGLIRAKVAVTNMAELCRGVHFITAGTTNSKKDNKEKVTELFLSSEVIHPLDQPDRVAHRGLWCSSGEKLALFRGTGTHKLSPVILEKLKAMAPNERVLDCEWRDLAPHATAEPAVRVYTGASLGSEPTTDVFFLRYMLVARGWRWLLVELQADATLDDVLAELGGAFAQPPLDLQPRPPSGLVPAQPSFASVAVDAYYHDGVVRRVGATPGKLVYAETYLDDNDAELYGVPLGKPSAEGMLQLYELDEPDAVRHLVDDCYLATAGELVLTARVVEIDVARLVRHGGLVLVPPHAHHIFKTEFPTATRLLELVRRSDGDVAAIEEPLTADEAQRLLLQHASLASYEHPGDVKALLANEVVLQARPETQRTFADAFTQLRGFSLAKLLTIAGERALVPRGNRSLAFDLYIEDLEDLRDLLTARIAKGWAVAEKEEDKLGRVQSRKRGRGYLMPFTHDDADSTGTNVISYYLETKRLDIRLGLGLFGLNGKYVKGATPPPRPQGMPAKRSRFDPVTRAHELTHGVGAVVWTPERFESHFA